MKITSFWLGDAFGRRCQGVKGLSLFREPFGDRRRREDFRQQVRQFTPFSVFTAPPDAKRERFEIFQCVDLGLQLGNRSCRGRLIENLLFGGFDLVFRRVLQILDIFGIERGSPDHRVGC